MAERKLHKTLDKNIHKAEISQKNIFSEDGNLKFYFMISLENIVIIEVVTKLWMNQNIQEKIIKSAYNKITPRRFKPDLKEVENYVIDKVSQLPIAKSIAKKLADVVPIIGNSISNWIEYHDTHVFGVKAPSENSAVYLINNIIWTTGGKIDYAQTARNILADRYVCLSDDHKYKLACNCCLEEEIATIASNVVTTSYLKSVDIYDFPMVHFWSGKVTGDYTGQNYRRSLFRHSKATTLEYMALVLMFEQNRLYNHILRSLTKDTVFGTKTCNGVPIIYTCNLFSEDEKVGGIVKLLNEAICESEIIYSLLSNLKYEQQIDILRECSDTILSAILHDRLRREHFLPIALHTLDVIQSETYMNILGIVLEEKRDSREESEYIYDQYKFIFMELWQQGSKRLKDYMFDEKNIHSLERFVTYYLSWNRDMDIIEMIFNDLNAEQEKRIRLGSYGMRYCSYLMLYDQWDLLELYIKYALFPQKCSSCIHKRHIKKELGNYESFLEAFIKREYFEMFSVLSKVRPLRQTSSYIRCKTIFELLSNQTDFKVPEDNFHWYFDESCIEIKWFRKRYPEFFLWILTVCKLVEEDKYEFLYHKVNTLYPIVSNSI